MSDFWTPLSPTAIWSALIIGIALGAFLWVSERRMDLSCLVHTALPGTAFLAFMVVSREFDRHGAGSFWFGVSALWVLYITTAVVFVLVLRWSRKGTGL
jgi:hypothetical protein